MAERKPQMFVEGRHKNKTYQQVFETDQEFCQAVLKSPTCNKYYPVEFKEFLLSKLAVSEQDCVSTVCECGPKDFLRAFSADMKTEFEDIIGIPKITVKEVHPPCDSKMPTSGFLGIFCHLFIKKCIFNLQDVDGREKSIQKHTRIFPFKVNSARVVHSSSLLVTRFFDRFFKQRIQDFLNRHFDDVLFDDVVPCFLSNIYLFRQQNFSEDDVRRLNNLMKVLQNEGIGFWRGGVGKSINTYLRMFPRLNENGAKRFRSMNQLYNYISQQYPEPKVVTYTQKQLMNLPEINCQELFCLLDEEFFAENYISYVELFEKYLFFFVGAREINQQPVFFIDDMLFECLKSFQTFKKSRDDVLNLCYEFSMLTLVYRRKQPTSFDWDNSIDESNLISVKNFIESSHCFRTALIDYEIVTDFLECTIIIFLKDEGTCFDVRYSKIRRTGVRDFYASILIGALNPQITRLVTYNAYVGEESSVDMPPVRDKLLAFIRKYNRWDFTTELPATKFLTWGLEHCFVENTIE